MLEMKDGSNNFSMVLGVSYNNLVTCMCVKTIYLSCAVILVCCAFHLYYCHLVGNIVRCCGYCRLHVCMRAYKNYAIDVKNVIVSTHTRYVCVNYAYIPLIGTLILFKYIF